MTDRHAGRVALAGRGLVKRYTEGVGRELVSLGGVDVEVSAGGAVAIVGAAGAGKSTLLHLLGCLDRPTAGTVLIEGRAVDELDDRELAAVRNRSIGFVF